MLNHSLDARNFMLYHDISIKVCKYTCPFLTRNMTVPITIVTSNYHCLLHKKKAGLVWTLYSFCMLTLNYPPIPQNNTQCCKYRCPFIKYITTGKVSTICLLLNKELNLVKGSFMYNKSQC